MRAHLPVRPSRRRPSRNCRYRPPSCCRDCCLSREREQQPERNGNAQKAGEAVTNIRRRLSLSYEYRDRSMTKPFPPHVPKHYCSSLHAGSRPTITAVPSVEPKLGVDVGQEPNVQCVFPLSSTTYLGELFHAFDVDGPAPMECDKVNAAGPAEHDRGKC